jgi:D-psicose/D-tagatose/L-ribulose 3-epimerase
VKLAVSNIAWDPSADAAAAALLLREGARGVEIAPTKWRDAPFEAPAADVSALRRGWEERGLPIVALQSLLFGRPDLQLFGTESERAALLDHLRKAADFAAAVGARSLVFGSPKNRMRRGKSMREAMTIACDSFRALASHAREREVVFCIEANPPDYGCDFITRTSEAAELCRLVDDPALRVNADLGGMILAGEDPADAVANAGSLVGHVHASEPQLAELSSSAAHERAGSALAERNYGGWISIEMRTPPATEQMPALARAIRLATAAYGRNGNAAER